ncbi:MAG TPA: flavodoxin-dependent (E)-4-hydroxy-3-methylbut-2-enyl-diphosphate synthase, partial [bacterium]|nr:flavodoxin-dependent (E)-4-hydroxy-3-methylbut-2-enyl-diphosphate synthase [bacterium]
MGRAKRKTREITVGGVRIGGGAPVAVQSMTKTPTTDVNATLAQIRRLSEAGCELVRVAVPQRKAVADFSRIAAAAPMMRLARWNLRG